MAKKCISVSRTFISRCAHYTALSVQVFRGYSKKKSGGVCGLLPKTIITTAIQPTYGGTPGVSGEVSKNCLLSSTLGETLF